VPLFQIFINVYDIIGVGDVRMSDDKTGRGQTISDFHVNMIAAVIFIAIVLLVSFPVILLINTPCGFGEHVITTGYILTTPEYNSLTNTTTIMWLSSIGSASSDFTRVCLVGNYVTLQIGAQYKIDCYNVFPDTSNHVISIEKIGLWVV
jgi:hypothetical protein